MTSAPQDPLAAAVARANAFFALSRCFDLPTRWPADLGTLVRDALGPLGTPASRLADEIERRGSLDALAAAHARLFVGPFRVDAPPWASAYLEPDGQLMGTASAYARTAYARAGLDTTTRTEAPDHVAFELEFMYYLAFREAETGDAIWFERQARFWREHLGRWLPRLAALMRDGSPRAAPYAALADVVSAFSPRLDAAYDCDTGVPR